MYDKREIIYSSDRSVHNMTGFAVWLRGMLLQFCYRKRYQDWDSIGETLNYVGSCYEKR